LFVERFDILRFASRTDRNEKLLTTRVRDVKTNVFVGIERNETRRPIEFPVLIERVLFRVQVSWVRHRDIHLLTVGRYTYTGDQRFRSINQPPSEDWTLQIKYPQIRDSGVYECQISTTPHISQYIHLQVVGEYPRARDDAFPTFRPFRSAFRTSTVFSTEHALFGVGFDNARLMTKKSNRYLPPRSP